MQDERELLLKSSKSPQKPNVLERLSSLEIESEPKLLTHFMANFLLLK